MAGILETVLTLIALVVAVAGVAGVVALSRNYDDAMSGGERLLAAAGAAFVLVLGVATLF